MVDHDINSEILHRRVEILLDGRLEAVNFVDEEDSSSRHRREETRQISSLLDRRTTRSAHLGLHGIAQDVGQSRLTESGRAAQQDVLERFVPLAGRFDHQQQTFDRLRLPAELLEHRGSQRHIERRVWHIGIDGKIFGAHKDRG